MANIRGTSLVSPNIVGPFIRERREGVGLSQRALGLLFEPAVTTQFISNIERGVTPLPPLHVATLVRVLKIPENELLLVMEREYAAKISKRVGRADTSSPPPLPEGPLLRVAEEDRTYFQAIYDAYRQGDEATRTSFHTVCESLLHVAKPSSKAVSK